MRWGAVKDKHASAMPLSLENWNLPDTIHTLPMTASTRINLVTDLALRLVAQASVASMLTTSTPGTIHAPTNAAPSLARRQPECVENVNCVQNKCIICKI